MQCPGCGYEADEASVFCPQCRFQFRDLPGESYQAADTIFDLPERGGFADDTAVEETILEERLQAFTPKELRQMEVQIITPVILVILVISLFTYSVISAVPFVSLTIAGLNFGVTGIICLASGLFCGILFFFIMRRSLKKFRYR